jgi:hypothetical protein
VVAINSPKSVIILVAIVSFIVLAAFSSIQPQTSLLQPAKAAAQSNPYANPHSQAVANWVVNNMYNSQVNMLATDPTPGCVDANGGVTVACADAFWTTSDNLPTCATLTDFEYSSIADACINKILGCDSVYVPSEWQTNTCPNDPLKFHFTSTGIPTAQQATWLSGFRYEAFFAIPIPIGAPGDQHFIVTTGTLSNGKPYAIEADIATLDIGTQDFYGPVDVVAPQCINEYLRGNLAEAITCANALLFSWDGNGVGGAGAGGTSGTYSTWQLGQAMFVMRVLGMDTKSSSVSTNAGTMSYSALFNAMEAKLWAVQAAYTCPVGSSGCLPNAYNASNQGSGGTDAENQDAGLLPFSASVINLVKNSFGECSLSGAPPGPSNSQLCDSAATSTTSSTGSISTTTSTISSPITSTSSLSSSATTSSSTITSIHSSTTKKSSTSTHSSTGASNSSETNNTLTSTNETTISSNNGTSTSSSTLQVTDTVGVTSLTSTNFTTGTNVTNIGSPVVTQNSVEAIKVHTAAIAMGTGTGAVVFLGGLFPISYLSKKDLNTKRSRRRKRSIASIMRSDILKERLGRS